MLLLIQERINAHLLYSLVLLLLRLELLTGLDIGLELCGTSSLDPDITGNARGERPTCLKLLVLVR